MVWSRFSSLVLDSTLRILSIWALDRTSAGGGWKSGSSSKYALKNFVKLINIFLQLISFTLSVFYLSSSWSTFGSSNSGTTYFLAFLAGSSCFTDFFAFLACCLAKLKLAVTLKSLQWQFHEIIYYIKIYLSESNFTEKPTGNKSPRLQKLVQYLHVHVVCIRIFYFGLHQLAI